MDDESPQLQFVPWFWLTTQSSNKTNIAIHEFCPFYTSIKWIPFYLSPANNIQDISLFHLFCGTNSSGS